MKLIIQIRTRKYKITTTTTKTEKLEHPWANKCCQ